MSFAAVTALIAVYERIERRRAYAPSAHMLPIRALRHAGAYMIGIALTTLVASIAIAPFAAYHFHKLAQFSLLANLAAMPFFGLLVMPAALISLVTMPFGLEGIPLQIMAFGVEKIVVIAQTVSQWDHATIPVATMPLSSLLALVTGGLWLTLWRTRWRLLGIPLALVGALTASTLPKPDLLIGRDGELFAMRSSEKTLTVTGAKRPNYSLEQWLKADGDLRDPAEALKARGLRCDELACVTTAGGKTIAFVRHPAALAEECARADIVVSQIPINRPCPKARVTVDRIDLWKDGAHALYFDGQSIRVETVAAARGHRPWSRPLTRKRKAVANGTAFADETAAR